MKNICLVNNSKKFNHKKQSFFMKKGISISTILSFAMATMLVIAAALVIHLMFPYIGTKGGCYALQRLHIEEIDSMSKDAELTGTTYLLKFKIEDCVECMWYYPNTTFNPAQDQIKIRWDDMSTTDYAVIMNVTNAWDIGDNGGNPNDDNKCVEGQSQ